jgi:hypothetical protein
VASKIHKNVLGSDPLAASWARDLPRSEDRAAALWLLGSLDRETGEGPSPGQAACWLDIKHTYLELRPLLRWVLPASAMRSKIDAPSSNWDSALQMKAVRERFKLKLSGIGDDQHRKSAFCNCTF